MLVGFAIENLLKALHLAREGVMYENGILRYREFGGVKNHDLCGLADHIKVALNKPERGALKMLSRIMTGIGRYPESANPTTETHYESWCSPHGDETVASLVHRLKETIAAEL